MPMYEFFCAECNTIFTFFSKSINTTDTPPCPKCPGHTLDRMVSRFSFAGQSKNDSDKDDYAGGIDIDESRMEQAMESLAGEAESLDENDPRQAANLMRRLSKEAGLRLGDKMEEAISRMEAGDDPDSIEAQMGDISEKDLFKAAGSGKNKNKKSRPLHDSTIYDM